MTRFPLHVTIRCKDGLPALRRGRIHTALVQLIERHHERWPGFRIVAYSLQQNHLHAIVEADGARAFARGIRGLCIRVARQINRALGRCGPLFGERHHRVALRTPTQVRRALVYVLLNQRKHRARLERRLSVDPPDRFSSGPWFDGWEDPVERLYGPPNRPAPTRRPLTWLLGVGWRRGGLISLSEVPGEPPD